MWILVRLPVWILIWLPVLLLVWLPVLLLVWLLLCSVARRGSCRRRITGVVRVIHSSTAICKHKCAWGLLQYVGIQYPYRNPTLVT